MKHAMLLLLFFLTVAFSWKKDKSGQPPISAYDQAGTYQCIVHHQTDSTSSHDTATASLHFNNDSIYTSTLWWRL